MPLYIQLCHGRDNPEEDMEERGFEGPEIGPIDSVQATYANQIRILKEGEEDLFLHVDGGSECVMFAGHLYGDWVVSGKPWTEEFEANRLTLQQAREHLLKFSESFKDDISPTGRVLIPEDIGSQIE